MFIAGLGVGPTFSVFTIVVQNAVPFSQLGVATSNLTFFRQIGGTVALAIVGTIFGSTLPRADRPVSSSRRTSRHRSSAGFGQATATGAIDFNQLTGVGDLGAAILAGIPEAFRGAVEPFIGNIVAGHPPGLQPGRRPDLLDRRRGLDHRGRRGGVHDRASPPRRMIESQRRSQPADADGGRSLRPTGTPAD